MGVWGYRSAQYERRRRRKSVKGVKRGEKNRKITIIINSFLNFNYIF